MSDLWQQFRALRDVEDDDERDRKESELWDAHRKRVEDAEPRLTCCEKGAKIRTAQYSERLDDAPHFGVSVERAWFPIAFCPFCAQPMPELEHAPQPGEHYMTVTDGGYYCDGCGERLEGCYCLPARCAWRVREPDAVTVGSRVMWVDSLRGEPKSGEVVALVSAGSPIAAALPPDSRAGVFLGVNPLIVASRKDRAAVRTEPGVYELPRVEQLRSTR